MSRGTPIPQHGDLNRLQFEMARRGLTVSQVAERSGLSTNTVSRATRGGGVTTRTALRLSACVFGEPVVPELQELYGERGAA